VRSVVHCSNAESRLKIIADIEAAVDVVISTLSDAHTGRHTRAVEPE